MNDENFKGIVAGLEDAIAFMQGDASRTIVHHAVDIKAIRKAVGKTQEQFAAIYHIPRGTLRDWEQGRRVPDAPARALLTIISRDPLTVERLLADPV
jgi:putative transcriptional regulator